MKSSASQTSSQVIKKLLTLRELQSCKSAWYERKTHAEISLQQGICADSVKKRIQRARRRLRAAGITPPAGPLSARRAPLVSLAAIENV